MAAASSAVTAPAGQTGNSPAAMTSSPAVSVLNIGSAHSDRTMRAHVGSPFNAMGLGLAARLLWEWLSSRDGFAAGRRPHKETPPAPINPRRAL